MEKRLKIETPYPNIFIILHYYMEAWPRGSYPEDDEYIGHQICYMHVESNGKWIKTWYETTIKTGKGFAAQRNRFIEKAQTWLSEYYYNAMYYHLPIRCNKIGNRNLLCPNIRINKDGIAGCGIKPSYMGYGGSSGIARPFPQGLVCDVFKIMCSNFTWDIPGTSLTLIEYWKCSTGESKKELEKETV